MPTKATYVAPFPLTGATKEDGGMVYQLATKADCLAFRDMADSTDNFVLHYDEGDVLVWDKKVKGESLNMIKVFGLVDCPPEALYDVLHDPTYRSEWDESRLEAFEVSRLDERQDIGYYAGKIGRGITDRDFVNQRIWHSAGNGEFVIFNSSVGHSKLPTRNGRVRATSKISGYVVRPWGSGSCLTYMTLTDPEGWIPHFVINFLTTKLVPRVLTKLRKAVRGYPDWLKKQTTHVRDWAMPEDPYAAPVKNLTVDLARKSWGGSERIPVAPYSPDDASDNGSTPPRSTTPQTTSSQASPQATSPQTTSLHA